MYRLFESRRFLLRSAVTLATVLAAAKPVFPAGVPESDLKITPGPVLWAQGGIVVRVLLEGLHAVGHLAELPLQIEIRPVLAPRVMSLSRLAASVGATLALNGGFFSRADGLPASYLVADGKTLADPSANQGLVGNPKIKKYLTSVLDRPEWRVWETPVGPRTAFESHHVLPAPGWRLKHALQAGPLLLPYLGLKEGAFVRFGDDAIASARRLGRSAILLKSDGSTLLLCMPKPPSSGLTIFELQKLVAKFGAQSAMALDGGDAAGFVLRPPDPKALWWGRDAYVRSALAVFAKPAPSNRSR